MALSHALVDAVSDQEDDFEDEASARAAQADIDNEELDDEEGLRTADAHGGVLMRYFGLVRDRLRLELSSRKPALLDPWLHRHLKQHDFL